MGAIIRITGRGPNGNLMIRDGCCFIRKFPKRIVKEVSSQDEIRFLSGLVKAWFSLYFIAHVPSLFLSEFHIKNFRFFIQILMPIQNIRCHARKRIKSENFHYEIEIKSKLGTWLIKYTKDQVFANPDTKTDSNSWLALFHKLFRMKP